MEIELTRERRNSHLSRNDLFPEVHKTNGERKKIHVTV